MCGPMMKGAGPSPAARRFCIQMFSLGKDHLWNNMVVVAVTKCWYQWIHFCGVLVQRSSSTSLQTVRPKSSDHKMQETGHLEPTHSSGPRPTEKVQSYQANFDQQTSIYLPALLHPASNIVQQSTNPPNPNHVINPRQHTIPPASCRFFICTH